MHTSFVKEYHGKRTFVMDEIDMTLFYIHYARLLAESYDIDVDDFSTYEAHKIVLSTVEGMVLIVFHRGLFPLCFHRPRTRDHPSLLLALVAWLHVMDVMGVSRWRISGEVEGLVSVTRFHQHVHTVPWAIPSLSPAGGEDLAIELEQREGHIYGKGTPEWAFLYMTLQKCCLEIKHPIPPPNFTPTFRLVFVYESPDNKDTVSLVSSEDTLGQITIQSRVDGITTHVSEFPHRLISALLRQSFSFVGYVFPYRYILMVNPEEAGSD